MPWWHRLEGCIFQLRHGRATRSWKDTEGSSLRERSQADTLMSPLWPAEQEENAFLLLKAPRVRL